MRREYTDQFHRQRKLRRQADENPSIHVEAVVFVLRSGSDVSWLNEGHEVWIFSCGLCDGVGGFEADLMEDQGIVNTIIASQTEARSRIIASNWTACLFQAFVAFLSDCPFMG